MALKKAGKSIKRITKYKKHVKTQVRKTVKKCNKKDKGKELYVGKVTKLQLPDTWDFKKATHVNYVKLDTMFINEIFVPLTQLEQVYGLIPEIYSYDRHGMSIKATLQSYPSDMDWTPEQDTTLLDVIPTHYFFKRAASRVCPQY